MKVKSESEVAQSCPSLSNPMDCSLPGSSIHGIFLARVLEWGTISSLQIHDIRLGRGLFSTFQSKLTQQLIFLQIKEVCLEVRAIKELERLIHWTRS